MKKISIAIKRRREENRVIKSIHNLLEPGLYFFSHGKRIIYKTKFNFDKRIIHLHCVFGKNNSNNTQINFLEGGGKYVVFFQDYVICVPKKTSFYYYIKNNYSKYSSIFTYPYAKITSFDDKKMSFTMENIVEKKHYKDQHHDLIVINTLLKQALISPIDHNNPNQYLQHGDVKRSNIIWTSYENFIFIDIDNMSFKPILFDVIHYASGTMHANDLLTILLKNTVLLEKINNKYHITTYFPNIIDTIFSNYIYYYQKEMPHLKSDYIFLNELDPKLFPLTSSLFGTMQHSTIERHK